MVRSLVMTTLPLTTMGAVGGHETEKVTVAPEAAVPTTTGNEPGPEPEHVVTVSVSAPAALATGAGSTIAQKEASPTTSPVAANP
jgi:pyocin large subunit-like protein